VLANTQVLHFPNCMVVISAGTDRVFYRIIKLLPRFYIEATLGRGGCLQTMLNLVKGVTQKELPGITVEPGEGVVALDQQGCVLSVSSGAERMLGWKTADIVGENFFSLSKFSLGNISALGSGSPCTALKTINCPHLNINGMGTK